MITCHACAASVSVVAKFCPECGATVGDEMTATAGTTGVTRSKTERAPPAPDLRLASDTFNHGRFVPGAVLGDRYRIVGLLGRGGMGEVYRAEDLKLGQAVALKFLPEGIERDRRRLERFLGEVRIARQVSHPNVCRVYDVGEVDGRHFLSMEYVDGEDLASLLRRIGRLPPDKGLDIARQLCAGLAASHDRGVLHRDLKPANVMLDGRGKARITDFGLAGVVEDFAAGADEIAGTPGYMAPEQLAGEPLSLQTDLYSLGLLLFEIFTGRRVHDTSSLAELRERHSLSSSQALSDRSRDLPAAIQHVVERCLERDPRRRPSSALAVAAALPGGDPLAAALAAGETPSPQMVAAAGEEGGLAPTVAVSSLVAAILLLAIAAYVTGRSTYLTHVRMEHGPQVLAVKAQDTLQRLGAGSRPPDSAMGFTSRRDLVQWIEAQDRSRDRWRRLDSARPPAVAFWYRTSPAPLLSRIFLGDHTGSAIVTPDDPPRTQPGMAYVELHPDGGLITLDVTPLRIDTTDAAPPAPNWSALFTEAGLDQRAFTPVPEAFRRATSADVRAAWTGPSPDGSGVELRVEAGAYRGRPVFFEVVAPWTRTAQANTPRSTLNVVAAAAVIGVILAILATAIVLAVRNIRLDRGDRRGASRLALMTGLLMFAAAMLTADHVAAASEVVVVVMAVSWLLFVSALVWVLYMAVEPYVRRRWPQVLISWTRLLSGRWRDPLVGRDILFGSVIGATLLVLGRSASLISAWRGVPAPPPAQPRWVAIENVAAAVGEVPHVVAESMFAALAILVVLVVIRAAVRNHLVAIVIFIALGMLMTAPRITDPVVDIPVLLVVNLITIMVITKLGLLSFAMAGYVGAIWSSFQPTLPPSQFHAAAMAVAIIAMLLPAAFGFYTSLAGRPMISGRFLDD